MRKQARIIKNHPMKARDLSGTVGSLPTFWLSKMDKADIAKNTQLIQEAFLKFSTQHQKIEHDLGGMVVFRHIKDESEEDRVARIEKEKQEFKDLNLQALLSLRASLRKITGLGNITVNYHNHGSIGHVYIINDGRYDYILKIFKPQSRIDGHSPESHQDKELRNLLFASTYDTASRSPKLFMGAFGRDGFIFEKFKTKENARKEDSPFRRTSDILWHSDRHDENAIGGTTIDFGNTHIKDEMLSVKVRKFANLIIDALERNDKAKAESLMKEYHGNSDFDLALDYISENTDITSWSYGRLPFPRAALAVFGKDEFLLKRIMGYALDKDGFKNLADVYDMRELLRLLGAPEFDVRRSSYEWQILNHAMKSGISAKELIEMGYDQHKVARSTAYGMNFDERYNQLHGNVAWKNIPTQTKAEFANLLFRTSVDNLKKKIQPLIHFKNLGKVG